ncbi:GNAT family N-acetyltransferase [Ruania zhangjianzhongii]|uniref:GNAT family N-acetyltransferase n=1 Tax=Ruania zhangjianzhongii TaxID=2603206 RepID=UPI001AEF6628|nr:GNAT family N-acetyltransferase [Ruania zhangjianzhongii]
MDDRLAVPTWNFRRLHREDFDQLQEWLADPVVARWWYHEVSDEALERDFGPSVDRGEPGEDLLALGDGVPAGLVQRCRLADYSEYATSLAALTPLSPQAWTVDYLLGAAHRGRGWAAAMLRAAVADLRVAHPEAAEIVVPVVAGNRASWRLLEATGFERIAEGDLEPDNPIDPPLHYVYRLGPVATVADQLPSREEDVLVRRLGEADAEPFATGTRDEAVREYGHLPLAEYTPQIVREQIDGVIRDGLESDSLAVLAVADADTDVFLGSLVLFDIGDQSAEVGFWLAPQARGRGVAQKTLRVAARLARARGLGELRARTHPENLGSRRALTRAGFTAVGEAREEATPSGARTTVLSFRCRLT